MDQTGSFIIDDGKTYQTTNSKDVWCKSSQSGIDKLQCTVQLTVFAEGIRRIRPLLIFRGQGLSIKNSKKEQFSIRPLLIFCGQGLCIKNSKKEQFLVLDHY